MAAAAVTVVCSPGTGQSYMYLSSTVRTQMNLVPFCFWEVLAIRGQSEKIAKCTFLDHNRIKH